MKTKWSAQSLKQFKTEPFDNQLLRTVGLGHFGGSSIGECLEIASHIKDGDFNSWFSEWYKFGEKLEKKADIYFEEGNHLTANSLYLRASNYYRTANTFINISDSRKKPCWQKSKNAFIKFAENCQRGFIKLAIPYKDIVLHGYLFTPDTALLQRPTILCINGGDSTNEEMYFYMGKTALEQGYNFIVFEGVGQNGCIFEYPQHKFIPDYENVVIPVINYLFENHQKLIASDHFILYGLSFGGYFAIRTACSDTRVKLLITNPPYLNFGKVQEEGLGSPLNKLPLTYLDKLVSIVTKLNPLLNYAFEVFKDILGVRKPSELFARLKEFSTETAIERLRCPILMLVGESEGSEIKRQANEIYSQIKVDKTLVIVPDADGGGAHCITNNLPLMNEIVFSWLHKHVKCA
jgi:hypothetical protein